MTAPTATSTKMPPPRSTSQTGAGIAVAAVMIGAVAFVLLFRGEGAAALHVWEISTAYGHCFFVLPIALYLAWDRRDSIRGTAIVPLPQASLLALPLAFAWLAAERVGVMEGRQLVAVTLLQILFLAVLGWRMWRAMAVPLLYLYFLVPFGAFVTPLLQDFTTRFIETGLGLLDIPYNANNFIIEIPEGVFLVAEACAGLRFLIAAVAFGVLYACLIYRSKLRRTAFIAASIVIPIIANGFRGLGIVVLGHIIGSAQAAAADHLIYGWVFFSAVILLLIVAGLPFREDGEPYLPIRPRGQVPLVGVDLLRAAIALAAVLLITAAGPATAFVVERMASGGIAAVDLRFIVPPGCTEAPAPVAADAESSHTATRRFACGTTTLAASVTTLPPRANPAAVVAAVRRATGELDAEDTEFQRLTVPGTADIWQLAETSEPARLTATALWIDGAPSGTGMRFRLEQAWRSVAGASHEPVLVAVSVDPGRDRISGQQQQALRIAMTSFIEAQRDLTPRIAALSDVSRTP